jgi:hypothetical protein
MATVPVKWIDGKLMGGAVPVTNSVGSMIAILDCALVNGFNLKSATSLSVSSGVATVDFGSSGHGYIKDQVVLISGVTSPTELNGEWVVTAALSTAITFSCVGIADGVATGAITCKCAPLGWIKLFSGTNKACYKSADVDSTKCVLSVDDSVSTVYANVRAYESMSDINTGSGAFPTSLQKSISTWVKLIDSSNLAATTWTIVGDTKCFYLSVTTGYETVSSDPNYNARVIYFFGDINTHIPNDGFHCLFSSSIDTGSWSFKGYNYGNSLTLNNPTDGTNTYAYLARDFTQIGGGSLIKYLGPFTTYSGYNTGLSYPNPSNHAIYLQSDKLIIEPLLRSIRGSLPGYYSFLNDGIPLNNNDRFIYNNDTLITMSSALDSSATAIGKFALSLHRSWR